MRMPAVSMNSLPTLAERVDAAASLVRLEQIRVRLLGKKGEITAQLKSLGAMEPEARRDARARDQRSEGRDRRARSSARGELERAKLAAQARGGRDRCDAARARPAARRPASGHARATRIETDLPHAGFTVADGPEIEDDWHNFEALNIPANHPARAMHDTFYFPRRSPAAHAHLAGAGARDAARASRRCA